MNNKLQYYSGDHSTGHSADEGAWKEGVFHHPDGSRWVLEPHDCPNLIDSDGAPLEGTGVWGLDPADGPLRVVELKFIPAPQGCEVYTLQITCGGKTSSEYYEAEDTRRLDHDVVDTFILAMKLGAIHLQGDAQTCAFYPQLGYELTEVIIISPPNPES